MATPKPNFDLFDEYSLLGKPVKFKTFTKLALSGLGTTAAVGATAVAIPLHQQSQIDDYRRISEDATTDLIKTSLTLGRTKRDLLAQTHRGDNLVTRDISLIKGYNAQINELEKKLGQDERELQEMEQVADSIWDYYKPQVEKNCEEYQNEKEEFSTEILAYLQKACELKDRPATTTKEKMQRTLDMLRQQAEWNEQQVDELFDQLEKKEQHLEKNKQTRRNLAKDLKDTIKDLYDMYEEVTHQTTIATQLEDLVQELFKQLDKKEKDFQAHSQRLSSALASLVEKEKKLEKLEIENKELKKAQALVKIPDVSEQVLPTVVEEVLVTTQRPIPQIYTETIYEPVLSEVNHPIKQRSTEAVFELPQTWTGTLQQPLHGVQNYFDGTPTHTVIQQRQPNEGLTSMGGQNISLLPSKK